MKFITYTNIIKFFGVILILSGLSCKKLIQIPPNLPSQIGQEAVFKDSANVMGAIAGIYTNFNIYSTIPEFHNGGITIFTGLSGDELTFNSSIPAYAEFNVNAISAVDNTTLTSLWTSAYKSIYQVNVCLEGINSSTGISAALKQQLSGELKVVRALYYFNLVNLFGKVPLVISTDYKINATLPRAPVDSVYNRIVTDLTGAQQLLKGAYPSAGRARPNLYTADALLAKVYLYRGQWKQAADMATLVINSGLYGMEQDLDKVFLDGSNEAIWQLPANGTYSQTTEGTAFIPVNNTVVPNYTLTTHLLDAFEANDLRKTKWLGISSVVSEVTTTNYYYPFKYKVKSPGSIIEDYMILRLGEQYLIRAEAFARQNYIPEALADLKEIRNITRVGIAEYAGSTDQSAVLNAIMHERQIELFCEWGNRWYDLKRTGDIDTVLGTEKTTWETSDALYPIPFTELQRNPFLMQNPGYN